MVVKVVSNVVKTFNTSVVTNLVSIFDNGKLVGGGDAASISSITITTAANSINSFDIQGTTAGVPVTLNLQSSKNTVHVGDTTGVQNIKGIFNINNQSIGILNVTVDDTSDTGTRTATIGTSITAWRRLPSTRAD